MRSPEARLRALVPGPILVPGKAVRILLVEDSRLLQRSVGVSLKKDGYVVDATGDGQEGLWLAESNDYDCIVLDLMLPGLDGLSILRRLREQEKNVPVLVQIGRA